jgi:uncharacterized protein with GYD domain
MPTHITLLQYTQQGIEKIKDGPTRLEAAKQSVRRWAESSRRSTS